MKRLIKQFDGILIFELSGNSEEDISFEEFQRLAEINALSIEQVRRLEHFVLSEELPEEIIITRTSMEHCYIEALMSEESPANTQYDEKSMKELSDEGLIENLKLLFGKPSFLDAVNAAFESESYSKLASKESELLFQYYYDNNYYKLEEIAQELTETQVFIVYQLLKENGDNYLKQLIDEELLLLEDPPIVTMLKFVKADDSFFDIMLYYVIKHCDMLMKYEEELHECFSTLNIENYSYKASKLYFYAKTFFEPFFALQKNEVIPYRQIMEKRAETEENSSNLLEDWLIEEDQLDMQIFLNK